jgi:hypothetical protein
VDGYKSWTLLSSLNSRRRRIRPYGRRIIIEKFLLDNVASQDFEFSRRWRVNRSCEMREARNGTDTNSSYSKVCTYIRSKRTNTKTYLSLSRSNASIELFSISERPVVPASPNLARLASASRSASSHFSVEFRTCFPWAESGRFQSQTGKKCAVKLTLREPWPCECSNWSVGAESSEENYKIY